MPDAIHVEIPLPIQIVIDDVGWWCGTDGSAWQEPYRTGITRDHVPADYAAIVSLGRQLGMKPQAAMVLCEWDKHNILRALPSATWMGQSWDNACRVGPWQEAAAQIIRAGRDDHLELTLHGIGHEYWQQTPQGDWEFTRAEWHDRAGTMRPRDEVLARLEYFQKLLDQHDLGAFPTSFVPCAFLHRFSAEQDQGLAAMLKQCGINFISTPFRTMYGAGQVQHGNFGFDAGVMTVDRGQDLQNWFTFGMPPEGDLKGAICGMHWPNMLHPVAERNEEIVSAWVAFLRPYNQRVDRMLAPDTATFATQLAHHGCTVCTSTGNGVEFDLGNFWKLPQHAFIQSLQVRIAAPRSTPRLRFEADGAAIGEVEETGLPGGSMYVLNLRYQKAVQRVRLKWQNV